MFGKFPLNITIFVQNYNNMKVSLILSYALSIVAFLMMINHLPGNGLLFVASFLLQVLLSVIYAIRSKEFRPLLVYSLSCSVLILYLVGRLMFWPYMYLVEAAIFLVALHLYNDYKRGSLYNIRNGVLIKILICGIALSFVSTSSFYKFKYGSTMLSANEVSYDENCAYSSVSYQCTHWAHYSYFLAIEGNKTEALESILVSIEIADRANCKSEVIEALQQQRRLIETEHNTQEELLPVLIEEWSF